MANTYIKRRLDYQPSPFEITETKLNIILDPDGTEVESELRVIKNSSVSSDDASVPPELTLDGVNLTLLSVSMDGVRLQEGLDYVVEEESLRILRPKDSFTLNIQNTIAPSKNTSLEGLYFMQGFFCTQCEAEGFRKITYYLDRPDVLSVFWVTITAPSATFPYLLSNGNLISDSQTGDTKTVTWHDPFPKPSYLFALVAGDFDVLEDHYITKDNRDVTLQLFVEKGRKHQGQFALDSLKRAMKWDEDKYDLVYDLEIYMIVAADFFNMGAMENKGLNVFNSKFVLAEPATATDVDFFNIESIIAHEYFHNWTGNRVTCRDWFQLSLKEGLTVFRDQQFSADMASKLSTRISQVKTIRGHQFAEDSGPMSHPIRPDEVMEMNNFYTVTVYNKGAEVIRMLHTLLGETGFQAGMKCYFDRFDGQAVTCDDFVDAMQDANNTDLTHFKAWYSQSGTPHISISKEKKGDATEFNFTQVTHKTADQSEKVPLYVPIRAEFLAKKDDSLDVSSNGITNIIVDSEEAHISLAQSNVVPVFLDQFSAPVVIHYEQSLNELMTIISASTSDYAKWDASQNLYTRWIMRQYDNNRSDNEKEVKQFASLIESLDVSLDVMSELLALPAFDDLAGQIASVDPLLLEKSIIKVEKMLAQALYDYCVNRLQQTQNTPYQYEQRQVHQRAAIYIWLKLACIAESDINDFGFNAVKQRYANADNMTDKLNCLKVAQCADLRLFDTLMEDFEQTYRDDAIVMDKWFSLHATTSRDDVLARLDLLMAHARFDINNPNKVRAVIGSFGFFNITGLHATDNSGYKFLCDHILKIDKLNPQVASRILTPMLSFKRYAPDHQDAMKAQLARMFNTKGISKDLFEKISKSLSMAEQSMAEKAVPDQ